MKKLAKSIVAAILGYQVRELYEKNKFQVVGVAGSIGKTSTKLAVANVLKVKYRVQYQDGNYNDLVTVPLIFFGENTPSLMNPFAWLGVFWRNQNKLGKEYPYDIVVVEVSTDGPGQINQFAKYLKIDLAVLTAITTEHMEYFADLDAVGEEEIDINKMATNLLYNKDLVPKKYLKDLSVSMLSYGMKPGADFQTTNVTFKDDQCDFEILSAGKPLLKSSSDLISEPQLYSVTAAVAVASQMGMNASEIDKGIHNIHPVSGRMQRLKGLNGSLIIDDTYNASPEAMRAAIDTLSRLEKSNRVAVLGNMNELGGFSEEAHKEIGNHCDSKKINLVITIGPDANKYLAPAAEAKGCRVQSFNNPYAAGEYLKPILEKGSAVLVKGSQNGVFAEETVKILLANPDDAKKLVRQSDYWIKTKQKTFKT